MARILIRLLSIPVVAGTPTALGQIVYVDEIAVGARDGSSWDDAFVELQTALTTAAPGTQIWVAEGTYRPDYDVSSDKHTGDREASFVLRNGIAVYGGFEGYETRLAERVTLAATVLSGDLDDNDFGSGAGHPTHAENSVHVVTANGVGDSAVLDGFIIDGGKADGQSPAARSGAGLLLIEASPLISRCTFRNHEAVNDLLNFSGGAGAFVFGGEPRFVNCRFEACLADHGGGTLVSKGAARFERCTFRDCRAESQGGGGLVLAGTALYEDCRFDRNEAFLGGGIQGSESSLELRGCRLSRNTASRGAGVESAFGQVIIIDSFFDANAALAGGGGIYQFGGSLNVTATTFTGNRGVSFGSEGGAVQADSATVDLRSSVFTGNSTLGIGGGFNGDKGDIHIVNCTFFANAAPQAGGGVISLGANTFNCANTIFWNNQTRDLMAEDTQLMVLGQANVSYSLIQGLDTFAGNGNVDVDPRFLDADGPDDIVGTMDDNTRLAPGSPAIDAGNSAAVPDDLSTDLDGQPRQLDDPSTPDGGAGGGPAVDIGADEFAAPLFVDDDASGANDGSGWADAFDDLQDALAAASAGDMLWVAEGTYRPAGPGGDPQASFTLEQKVSLYGGFLGTEQSFFERGGRSEHCILSGDLDGNDLEPCDDDSGADNALTVVNASTVQFGTLLQGFTITGGRNTYESGGGLLNDGGHPVVADCRLVGNCAHRGGGMANLNGGTAHVIDCLFSRNSGSGGGAYSEDARNARFLRCRFENNAAGSYGGGINLFNSSLVVRDCVFEGNTAGRGGGIRGLNSTLELTGTSFIGNSAPVDGGGLWSFRLDLTMDRCLFVGNETEGRGGGAWLIVGESIVSNCAFVNNTAAIGGGAFAETNDNRFTNCTFAGNHAGSGGGLFIDEDQFPFPSPITNCVLWGNSADDAPSIEAAQFVSVDALAEVTYSLIEGLELFAGIGNVDGDPRFLDLPAGDARPGTGSAAIDAGTNAVELEAVDLAGGPRFRDDPATPDTGFGAAPIVDLGAYEFQDITRLSLVESMPPDGAVDAGQPSALSGGSAQGWDRFELVFDGDAALVQADDFALAASGGRAPAIGAIDLRGATVFVELDGPIRAGECTTLTYEPSGASVSVGFLPGDVSADGISGPVDILTLVDGLNGTLDPPLDAWQCDIDRSGMCGPGDILTLINLLNGAGAFDPWNGRTLPKCP